MKKPPINHDAETAEAALAWAMRNGQGDELSRRVQASVKRTRRRRVATLGTVAGVVVLLALFWRAPSVSPEAKPPVIASAAVTLPDHQMLPDGTLVEFKAGAQITTEFTATARRVILRQGEAHFAVTHDPARPFIVSAHGVEVRAVGTAFSVDLRQTSVEVLVTEGRVAVDRPNVSAPSNLAANPSMPGPVATPDTQLFVDAGHVVVLDFNPVAPPPTVLALSADDLSERGAWRIPRLEFNGTPLEEAIPMFNQHGHLHLVLDPSLGSLQMSGTLRADNADALLRLLQSEFGIRADARGEEIFLHR